MADEPFDAWTRGPTGRRSRRATFGLLGVASLGLPLVGADAKKKKKKKRCKKADRGCGPGKRCCRGLACTAQVCCPPERVFFACDNDCLCPENQDFCCAFEATLPPGCNGTPAEAPALCCPPANVCGDVCCNPVDKRCIGGVCTCILPNPNDCQPDGGFSRVRRFP